MEIDLITFGVFKTVGEIALATGCLLGITALVGNALAGTLRDRLLPVFACLLGIGIACASQISHGDTVSIVGVMVGVVFGGSVTGLYKVTKDIKQTPQTVVNN